MDGRETMFRTGSPLHGVDTGGRQRSDGEGQQDEESNPLASSVAAQPSAVEVAEIIMGAMKESEARQRRKNPHSGTSSRIEIRHKTYLQTITGVFKKGENVEIALRVFKSSFFGWLNREGFGWCARKP